MLLNLLPAQLALQECNGIASQINAVTQGINLDDTATG